ncbi:MAG: hypothetical protein JJV94_06590, partial [Sulfurospirillum sp.]|nr:hypothetical protein [Sulfurospirillum sp.]
MAACGGEEGSSSGDDSSSGGDSSWNKEVAPTGVSASYNSATEKIDISWNSKFGATGYSVYRADELNGVYSFIGQVSLTLYSDSSIAAGKTYYYKIEAINDFAIDEVSPLSISASATCPELKAPTGVSASYNSTTEKIDINWDSVSLATKYGVYRADELSGDYLFIKTVFPTSYSDSNITAGETYYYKIKTLDNYTESPFSIYASATCQFTDSEIYLSVIAFNENLTTQKFTRLNYDSKDDFDSFIDDRNADGTTSLYWAVDNAIVSIKNTAFPDDIDNISIVTFTDGLDTSSLHASDYKHTNNSAYLDALKIDINTTKVKDIPLSAYAIGFKGTDVKNEETFKENLEGLSSKDNNYTVDDINEIEAVFTEIAESLTKTNSSQSLALSVSIPDSETKIRFTFDDNISEA